MPLYEYRCTQCGNRYEKIQKLSDTPDTACPKCGGKVERPLSAPALQFKGAGWYINDYAPKAASGSASKSPESSSGGESKAAESKPAESKPAAASSTPAPTAGSSTSTSGNS